MTHEKKYSDLHLVEVQGQILKDNKQKAGIYMILNKINNYKFVGSAATNRIYVRFRNHFFHGTGSKLTAAAVAKHGIENFEFYVLEYYPGFVKKENLSSDHTKLLELETKYIELLKPEYNILQLATSSNGYKHTDLTKQAMIANYSRERREKIASLNRGKSFTEERKLLLSKIATLRNSNTELREKLSRLASKPVTLYNKDGSVHSKYPGIRAMAKHFSCCNKTINKAIREQSIFRNIGVVHLDQTKD